MKCDSRISISDYGYYECELEKNHEGEHCWFSKRENNINKKYPLYIGTITLTLYILFSLLSNFQIKFYVYT